MSEHPDAEGLSAYLDGEAPEWTSHVEGCTECRSAVATLGEVRSALARPPAALDETARDRAIARAVIAATRAGDVTPLRRASTSTRTRTTARRTRLWLAIGSVAAVMGGLLVAATVLTSQDTRPATDTASRALDEKAQPTTTVAVRRGGNLGDVADIDTLRARIASSAAAGFAAPPAAGEAGVEAQTSAASDAARSAAPPPASPSTTPPPEARGGLFPCEGVIRVLNQTLGPLMYYATASWQGRPAVVLGFAPSPGVSAPLSLFVTSQSDCQPIAQATTP